MSVGRAEWLEVGVVLVEHMVGLVLGLVGEQNDRIWRLGGDQMTGVWVLGETK